MTVKLLVKTSAKKHMFDQILTLTDRGGFALDMYGETSLHSGWRNLHFGVFCMCYFKPYIEFADFVRFFFKMSLEPSRTVLLKITE